MGMFDNVKVTRDEFVCSEGHDMRDEWLQTKDFDCSMSTAIIGERLEWQPHAQFGMPMDAPFLGRIRVYAFCSKCPAYVIRGRMRDEDCEFVRDIEVLHEFAVEIIDDAIRSVKRTSGTLAEEVASVLREGDTAEGPMPREEAKRLSWEWHAKYWEARRTREAGKEPTNG